MENRIRNSPLNFTCLEIKYTFTRPIPSLSSLWNSLLSINSINSPSLRWEKIKIFTDHSDGIFLSARSTHPIKYINFWICIALTLVDSDYELYNEVEEKLIRKRFKIEEIKPLIYAIMDMCILLFRIFIRDDNLVYLSNY